MIPSKLKPGDKICVIAPARSMGIISDEVKDIALNNLEKMGLEVVFGKNIYELDEYVSSSIESRITDLHNAFSDKSIKAILTVIGGFNSNQLINKLDYKLIKQNPKILCGFSDITAISNAIYAKTGITTYYGPHFSSLGMKKGLEYTLDYFQKCFFSLEPYNIEASNIWSDDEWHKEQQKRNFFPNEGHLVINTGNVVGTLIGGNLCTFNLLQGTDFFPDIKCNIIMIEEDCMLNEMSLIEFDRNLQSIIECKGFSKVKGILIGRFQIGSKITNEKLIKVIRNKKELEHIPVIANINFGHTTPIATLPIGGKVSIRADGIHGQITVIEH